MQLRLKLLNPTLAEVLSQGDYVTSGPVKCYSRYAVTHGFDENQLTTWTPLLRNTRGLVYDQNGSLISRSGPKFFNSGEGSHGAWKPEYDALHKILVRKIDGFSAMLHYRDGAWRVNTKAGVEHEFEAWALELLRAKQLIGNWPTILDTDTVYWAEGCHASDDHVLREAVGLHLIATWERGSDYMVFDTDNFAEQHTVNTLAEAVELQRVAMHEGYCCYLFDDSGKLHEILKFKSPEYLRKRLAKRIAMDEAADHLLWRQFKLNPDGTVFYDWTFAREKLDEFYDDFSANKATKVRRVELELNTKLMYARAFVEGNVALQRREFYEKAGDEAPLIMALFDSNPAKVLKVLNQFGFLAMSS